LAAIRRGYLGLWFFSHASTAEYWSMMRGMLAHLGAMILWQAS
jgi:hypothetical protein